MSGAKKGLWETLRLPVVLGLVCAVSGGSLGYVYSKTKAAIEQGRKRKVIEAFQELVPGFDRFESEDGPKAGEVLYSAFDAENRVLAYGANTAGEGSYNSMKPIRLITVMDAALSRILGVRVVESEETPGLGERIKDKRKPNTIVGKLTGRPDRTLVEMPSGEKREYDVVARSDKGVKVLDENGVEEWLEGARIIDFPPAFQDQFSGRKPAALQYGAAEGDLKAISGATVSSTAVLNAVRRGVGILQSRFAASEPR